MVTGDATVVGAAAIEIYPLTTGFQERVKEETAPAFGGLSKDAERAGEESGGKLSKGFSKGTSGIASTLAGLGLPLGNLGGHLSKTADGLGKVDSKGKGLTGTLSTLGGGTLAAATAGVVGFGVAGVKAAASYESATATIAAQAHIGAGAAKAISDEFLKTTGHVVYSADAIAKAYGGVAGVLGSLQGRALSGSQAQKVMASSMDLAEGAGISLESSTQSLAKTMQAYHLQVGESAKATDILFTASRETGIPIEQLTAGLTRTKSKLGDLAPSLGESAGMLVSLAKAGVTGRTAISTLSTSFQTLVGGSKETTATADKLGIHIFDASGKFVGMRSVLEQLSPKLAQYNGRSQEQITKALFGKTANQQFLDVLRQGPAVFTANTAAVTRTGAAHEAAQKQAKTLGHQFDLVKATATDLAIKFGNFLIPKLKELAGTISEGISWLGKHKEAAKALATVITTILGVAVGVYMVNKMKAFTDSFVKAGRTLGVFAAENTATAATVETEGAAIVGSADTTAAGVDTALGATGVGLVIVGLGLAATELATHWHEAMQGLEEAAQAAANFVIQQLNKMIEGVEELEQILTLGLGPSLGRIGEISGAGGGGESRAEQGARGVTEALKGKEALKGPHAGIVEEAAVKYHIDPKVLWGVFGNETSYGKNITTSSAGAMGGFQFIPETAKKYGYPLTNHPNDRQLMEQADAAAHYLSDLIKSNHGNVNAALNAYSGGGGSTYVNDAKKNAGGSFSLPSTSHHTAAHHAAAVRRTTESYVDPFTSASHLVRGREDEGIDFTASPGSKIRTIGTGIINKIIPNWFKGQPLIEELLTSGPEKGKHVYYAEQINKAVREGQHVKAGQMIGTVASHGTGLELGFGAGGGRTLAQATTGYTEGQKTPAAAEFSKFLASVGKGGSQLQTASKVFETVAKAELHKQTADKKTGESTLQKMTQAIQSGGVKELSKVVGGTHDAALKNLVARLHSDHVAALDKLADKLTKVHEKALAAMARALVKLEEKQVVEKLKTADRIATQEAENTSTAIADAAKVTLDRAAEVGKAGAALAAAQAQTNADAVKAADDAAIGVAKLGVEHAAGHGELAEEAAEHGLVAAENAAKVAEANAQAALDLANNAATEAQTKATEENTKATEANTKASETTATTSPGLAIGNITIDGKGISTGALVAELGWAIKTGGLPVAPPAVPAVAA